jgi:hypothetical protein
MSKKRELFGELVEGFGSLDEQRAGKRTLRTHIVKMKPAPAIAARERAKVRRRLAFVGNRDFEFTRYPHSYPHSPSAGTEHAELA